MTFENTLQLKIYSDVVSSGREKGIDIHVGFRGQFVVECCLATFGELATSLVGGPPANGKISTESYFVCQDIQRIESRKMS